MLGAALRRVVLFCGDFVGFLLWRFVVLFAAVREGLLAEAGDLGFVVPVVFRFLAGFPARFLEIFFAAACLEEV